jgi:hypothetical protein
MNDLFGNIRVKPGVRLRSGLTPTIWCTKTTRPAVSQAGRIASFILLRYLTADLLRPCPSIVQHVDTLFDSREDSVGIEAVFGQ